MGEWGGIVCLEKWNGTATGVEKLQVNGTGVPPIGTKKKKKEEEDKKIEALFSYLQVGGRFIWMASPFTAD